MSATFKISDEVRDVLRRSTIEPLVSGKLDPGFVPGSWFLKLPEHLSDKKLYLAVNKVIEGAGGAWDRKVACHTFATDPRVALGLAVGTGVAVDQKQLRQAFYTPPEVARKVVELAGYSAGESTRTLEPSAGDGALLRALADAVVHHSCVVRVTCVEKDQDECDKLAQLAMHFNELDVRHGDFLSSEPLAVVDLYDRILMNPPWTKGQDVAHVLYALRHLKPGGVLVAVMPTSADPLATGRLTKARREWLTTCARNHARWHPLPDGSFRASGTSVKCGIVVMRSPSA